MSISDNVGADTAGSLRDEAAPMDIETLQDFFFRAMLAGYASGSETEPVPGMPGWKRVPPFKDESLGLMLVDMWCTHLRSGKSFGTTTIYFDGDPVWVMQYSGEYREEAVPLLKRALHEAYQAQEFHGGRGRTLLSVGGLTYYNAFQGDFGSFYGKEYIREDGWQGLVLGRHEYAGMLLV
jgi:hypothetical protein